MPIVRHMLYKAMRSAAIMPFVPVTVTSFVAVIVIAMACGLVIHPIFGIILGVALLFICWIIEENDPNAMRVMGRWLMMRLLSLRTRRAWGANSCDPLPVRKSEQFIP